MAFACSIANVSSGVPMRQNARDLGIGGSEPAAGSEPARRHQEPVAIIRIPRIWPGAARTAAASTGPTVTFTDPLTDSLEAFGSETETQGLTLVPDHVPQALAAPERSVPRDWSGVIAALKWVGVILFSATTAALLSGSINDEPPFRRQARSRFRRRRLGERCSSTVDHWGLPRSQSRSPPRRMPSR